MGIKLKKTIFKLMGVWIICAAAPFVNAEGFPKAVMEEISYEFSPVIAGTEVMHRFLILNQGDATLNIIDVHTG